MLLPLLLLLPVQEPPAPSAAALEEGVARAVALLLERQETYRPDRPVGTLPEGELAAWQAGERERLAAARARSRDAGQPGAEWPYEGVHRVRRVIPGGYRVGGTSIASLALLAAPGLDGDAERRAAVERALAFVLDQLEEDPGLAAGPKRGYDVRGWGHAYALRFLLTAARQDAVPEELGARVDEAIPHLLRCLEVNAQPGGGWNYADDRRVSPFMTGSTLLTLYLARDQGHAVDPELIAAALDALQRSRTEAVSYAYAGRARGAVAMPGSSARSAVAELALHLAERSEGQDLRAAVAGFFEGWDDLLARKSKQGTHEGPYGIAPYYFFFGHTYAALAIEHLPEEERPPLRRRLQALLWRTREEDGGWNDRVFPRSKAYSTAMALLALRAPALHLPGWPAGG